MTGRPRRVGWFDAVAARYVARANGLTALAITRLDALDQMPTIKICTGYQVNDMLLPSFPAESPRSKSSSRNTRSTPAGSPRPPAARAGTICRPTPASTWPACASWSARASIWSPSAPTATRPSCCASRSTSLPDIVSRFVDTVQDRGAAL